jgi:nicotinate dehydrogenase subunit A
MNRSVSFTLNGKPATLGVDADRMLLWVLRYDLGLTGTKFGCGAGLFGACTILVDDTAVRSCQTPVRGVAGRKVLTIEGLARDGKLHPLQEAFLAANAFQCGFCTSGQILSASALLRARPHATRAEIVRQMEGNLCRCGSHKRILEAVESAAAAPLAGGAK